MNPTKPHILHVPVEAFKGWVRSRPFLYSVRGPLALMAGAVLFSVMAISVKYAAERLPSGEIVMFRFLFGLIVLHIMSAAGMITISHRRWPMLIVRGVVGGLAIVFYFTSIKYTSLMKATLLGNAYPVFAALFGAIFLREKIRVPTVVVFLISAAGMWLVMDPKIETVMLGDLFGVASAATAGLAIVTIRELRKTENAFTIFWYLSVFGTAMGAVLSIGVFVWPTTTEWMWLFLLCSSSMAGQLLTTYGFRYSNAAEGAVIAMSTVAYSGLFGWMILKESVSLAGFFGGAAVLLGAVYLAWNQAQYFERNLPNR